jgi:hypothetical protein
MAYFSTVATGLPLDRRQQAGFAQLLGWVSGVRCRPRCATFAGGLGVAVAAAAGGLRLNQGLKSGLSTGFFHRPRRHKLKPAEVGHGPWGGLS